MMCDHIAMAGIATTDVCVGTTDVVMTDGHTATTGGSETFSLILHIRLFFIYYFQLVWAAKNLRITGSFPF